MYKYILLFYSTIFFLSSGFTQLLYNSVGHIPLESQENWYKAGLSKKQQVTAARIYNMKDNDGLSDPTDQQLLEHYIGLANGTDYTIIYFPAGDYYFDNNIYVTKSNIVLQGDGSDKSILHFNNHFLYILGYENSNTLCEIQNPVPKGTNNITSIGTNLFNEGDWIHFYESFFPIQGYLETANNYYKSVGQISRIAGIENNILILEDKASKTYDDTGESLNAVKITPVENVGIENLKISKSNIIFQYAVNCWVRGVESSYTFDTHTTINWSSHIEISGNYFHNAKDYEDGAYGINITRSTTNCLIENNVFKRLRHAMVLQAGANCNVFTYNYSYDVRAFWKTLFGNIKYDSFDLVLHGRYPYGNLFEQNHVVAIAGDDSHDSYGGKSVKNNGPYNAFLRNWARGDARLSSSLTEYGLVFRGTPKVSILGNVIKNKDIDFDKKTEVDIYSKIVDELGGYDNWEIIEHTQGSKYRKTSKYPNRSVLYDVSYYYKSRPDFLPTNYTFPSLGPKPDSFEELTQDIPARERRNWSVKTYFDENYITLYVPLAITISGPSKLKALQDGTFTANIKAATGLSTDFRWWVKTSGSWNELTAQRGKSTITHRSRTSFSIKCEVITVSNNDSETDTHDVVVVNKGKDNLSKGAFNETIAPIKFALNNYPNPSNSETTIQLDLPEEGYVSISVYNSMGQRIKLLVSKNMQPGNYYYKWTGKDNFKNSVSTGLYLIIVKINNNIYTLKTLLIK